MGNYATTTDLLGRFASSEEASFATDNESTDSSTISQAVANECLGSAEGTMDSFLGKKYLTPVDVSSDAYLASFLKSVALDLAEFYVLLRSPNPPQSKKDQHDFRVAWLEKVADGTIVLTGAEALPSTVGRGDTAFWSGSNRELPEDGPRVCSRETMVGF